MSFLTPEQIEALRLLSWICFSLVIVGYPLYLFRRLILLIFQVIFESLGLYHPGDRHIKATKQHSQLTGKDEMSGYYQHSKEHVIDPDGKSGYMVVKLEKKENK